MPNKDSKPLEGEVVKPKMGRPEIYRPWMPDHLITLAKQGKFVAGMCVELGIKERTFYHWVASRPEFKDAYEEAQVVILANLEKKVMDIADGKTEKGNLKALEMVLTNKYKQHYARANAASTEINIGQLNTIEKLDLGQLEDKIKMLSSQINLVEQKEEPDDEEDYLP